MSIDYDKRIYGLDLFRTIAILIVLITHGRLLSGDLFEDIPFILYIDGVELFFVLSGFLIGSILIKIIEKENGFNFSLLVDFWKRRWLRTLPNYYLILLANLILINYGITSGNIEDYSHKFLFFLQNFSNGKMPFYWESWSLSIEEWFYISLPLCILIFRQFLSNQKTILLSIVLLLILPLLYRISIAHLDIQNYYMWDMYFKKPVITRLDAIIYGVLGAYIKFYYADSWTKYRNWMFTLGLLILFLKVYITQPYNHFYTKTMSLSLTSLSMMLLLPKADSIKSFKYKFIGKCVTYVSIISYSLYLVNLGIVVKIIKYNFPPQNLWENTLATFAYWLATFAISAFIYKFYEKPIMNLRDKF
jgi:peptidoglycan/LPS O-acetylase OafA/YrhL